MKLIVLALISIFVIYVFYVFYKKLPKLFCAIFTVIIFLMVIAYTLVPIDKKMDISAKDAFSMFGALSILTLVIPALTIGFFWFLTGKVHKRGTKGGTVYGAIYTVMLGLISLPVGIIAAIIYFKNESLILLKRFKKYIPD